jgi:GNAT superfamily N-acetyltransferase
MAPLARPAGPADAEAIGAIHVRAWQAAYRGVMPDAYLDGLQAEDRAAIWRPSLEAPRPDRAVWVVEDDDGDVAGFAAFGPEAADPPRAAVGELYAINLDPDRWGRGLGRILLTAAERELGSLGHRSAVLWVVPSNDRARRLYDQAGWVPDGTDRQADVLGVVVPEMRYVRSL